MKRREFITLIVGAGAWPLAAQAQQVGLPVIGLLNGQSADAYSHLVAAFRQGLQDTGFVEGRNVAIEYRWAEGRDERLPALAAELVDRQVAALVTGGSIWSSISATHRGVLCGRQRRRPSRRKKFQRVYERGGITKKRLWYHDTARAGGIPAFSEEPASPSCAYDDVPIFLLHLPRSSGVMIPKTFLSYAPPLVYSLELFS